MNIIKQKCDKSINDYETAYKKTKAIQSKSESLKLGWQTFMFGGNQSTPYREISQYSPPSVRMMIALNDYIFTVNEAKAFYKEQLGLET